MTENRFDGVFGNVFDIQRFSLHDGPGIRTIVFLKGCPLRCLWCHNPEGLSSGTGIMYDPSRCIGCGECAAVCEQDAHTVSEGMHSFDRSKCRTCGKCTEICPSKALEQAGKRMSVSEVMTQVMKDEKYYRRGGGITLSGGEPLYQPDFASALLDAAREKGISTAVETSGFAAEKVFSEIALKADVLLLDYKLSDDTDHIKYTGVSRKIIDENALFASEAGIPIILRCPIIPGVNDNDAHFEKIAEKAGELKSVTEIHIEPYHTIGLSKYDLLGMESGFRTEQLSIEAAGIIVGKIASMTKKTVKLSK